MTVNVGLVQIERYLRRTKLAPSRFGRLVCNDPTLLRRIRQMGEISCKMREKIKKFMEKYPNGPDSPEG